ncbi:Transferase [Trema orientale]|uniref:Transferase n=1 Tax=Trema orientale TaxID=63057 RepID=A0A2P5CCP9_TREOI|nr:Transferase [Trema orientale]
MEIEILSRELVKPSSPTPSHLRDYKLCLLDQFFPKYHGGIIFFYSVNPDIIHANNSQNDNVDENYYCRILKKSLSDTLTDFYPIAGRFKGTSTIDCNDDGASVVEAKLNSTLSDFLVSVSQSSGNPYQELGKLVLSLDSETMELASNCMLIAQITIFECRGVAISFCLEHRFCDLSSVVVFLKGWSARARGGSGGEIAVPDFVGSSFLPPQDMPPLPPLANLIENGTTTRLVLDSSKISALKSKFITESGELLSPISTNNLSRVEVVLALILKSAISAARSVTASAAKSVILCAVNLRNRTALPLSENSIGNLIWFPQVTIEEGENVEFHEVVSKIKRETASFYDETVRRIRNDEEGNALVFEAMKRREEVIKSVDDVNTYDCSSWCRFPVYEMDFGWGRPVWVSSGVVSSRNLIVFVDTKCGSGIQAWVTFHPKVMAVFERDEELLSFASLNLVFLFSFFCMQVVQLLISL